MKKYTVMVATTMLIAAAIYAGGNFVKSTVAKVDIQVLEKTQVEHIVTCTGRIESAQSKKIYLPQNSKTEEVYVSVGDQVEEGDTLLCISRSLSSSSQSASSQSASSGQQIPQSILDKLPAGVTAEQAQQVYNNYLAGQTSSSPSSDTGVSSKPEEQGEKETENITAPISGIVSEINTNNTDRQAALVISDNNELQVRLSVPESQIASIQIGQTATISGVGFQNTQYHGTVTYIANIAKQQVSTTGQETVVEVVVRVDNPNNEMKAGYTAKCEIITSVDEGLLLVPYEAVQSDENGQEFVFLNQDGKAQKCYITTGRELEDGFEVLSGLQEGIAVVAVSNHVKEQDWLVVNSTKEALPDA